jgi:hypothetical protein
MTAKSKRTDPLFQNFGSTLNTNTNHPVIRGTLNVFFIFANGLCVFFHPEKKSLMDMKLGTQVMKPPPTPDHLKIRLFGRKVI